MLHAWRPSRASGVAGSSAHIEGIAAARKAMAIQTEDLRRWAKNIMLQCNTELAGYATVATLGPNLSRLNRPHFSVLNRRIEDYLIHPAQDIA
jgi:hypothetical protein